MPEDVAIFGKRFTGDLLIDKYLLRKATERDDSFEHDPEARAVQEIQKRNKARIKDMQRNPKKKRRGDAGALGEGFAPGTPEPPSPRLSVPKASIPATPGIDVRD